MGDRKAAGEDTKRLDIWGRRRFTFLPKDERRALLRELAARERERRKADMRERLP